MSTLDRAGPLRIVHVLRAPVGGLFRHVLDLAGGQAARGHQVGVIADSLTGGAPAESALAALAPKLALGVSRLPIRRAPHPSDLRALLTISRRLGALAPNVVHGHGSKGGALARLAVGTGAKAIRVYTPHGGSLHFAPGTPSHRLYMAMERLLQRRTDLLLFESRFAARRYEDFIGDAASSRAHRAQWLAARGIRAGRDGRGRRGPPLCRRIPPAQGPRYAARGAATAQRSGPPPQTSARRRGTGRGGLARARASARRRRERSQ